MYTGRLTNNATVKNVKGNKQVTEFTLVINRRYKNAAGQRQEKSLFINCSYWRAAAVAQYLTKGTIVTVSGWLGADAWTDREGNAQAAITLSVDNIEFYTRNTTAQGRPAGAAQVGKANGKAAAAVAAGAETDDDLPF